MWRLKGLLGSTRLSIKLLAGFALFGSKCFRYEYCNGEEETFKIKVGDFLF